MQEALMMVHLLMDEFLVHIKSECVIAIQSQGLEVDFIAGEYILVCFKSWIKGSINHSNSMFRTQHLCGQLQIRLQQNQAELRCQGGLSKHGIGSQQKALQTLGIQLVCMVIKLVGQ